MSRDKSTSINHAGAQKIIAHEYQIHDNPTHIYIVGIILLLDINAIIIIYYFYIALYIVVMTTLVTPKHHFDFIFL